MARTVAELPKGARITDYISLGVIAEKIPLKHVHRVLQETGRRVGASATYRRIPANWESGYLASPQPIGCGTDAPALRGLGRSPGPEANSGSFLPQLAGGEPGRLDPGRGR